ncbi:MAG: hypothetical protein HRU09_20500 [Oligoflexales bacterium]|nr:hypothetical protein [Oligoflexales bacterium]
MSLKKISILFIVLISFAGTGAYCSEELEIKTLEDVKAERDQAYEDFFANIQKASEDSKSLENEELHEAANMLRFFYIAVSVYDPIKKFSSMIPTKATVDQGAISDKIASHPLKIDSNIEFYLKNIQAYKKAYKALQSGYGADRVFAAIENDEEFYRKVEKVIAHIYDDSCSKNLHNKKYCISNEEVLDAAFYVVERMVLNELNKRFDYKYRFNNNTEEETLWSYSHKEIRSYLTDRSYSFLTSRCSEI